MRLIRFRLVLGAVTCVAATAVPAGAQPATDHLECYTIKDPRPEFPTPSFYTADVDGLVAQSGCTIRLPAQMACVPAVQANVSPTPPGAGATGIPNEVFCYKVKCPRATLPTLDGADQFGSRTVTPTARKLVCAPAVPSPRFVDNGDGTVTDRQTRLQWEKKTGTFPGSADPNDPHNVNNTYAWSTSGTAPDGTVFVEFLANLNACGWDGNTGRLTGGFAGHCDWRLPTIVELKTIQEDPSASGCPGGPCIDATFGPTAWAPACLGPYGACGAYWSSTAEEEDGRAWLVFFANGGYGSDFKNDSLNVYVRAVRSVL